MSKFSNLLDRYSTKTLITLCSIGFVILLFRLSLPYLLIKYATYQINKIPEYKVSIEDIDVHLIRGSYSIKGIALNKINNSVPVPFFLAKKINLSIEWNALLHGAFVGKIEAFDPVLNFVIEHNGKNQQLTISDQWEHAVKALFPLNFNKIIIYGGKVSLQSFQSDPPFNLSLTGIEFNMENIQHVHSASSLFSTFIGKGNMYGGSFKIEGRVNPLNEQPTFIFKSSLKSMKIPKANNFLLHFTHIDVNDGDFSLYSEIAAKNGKIYGYAKPVIKNLKILDKKKNKNPVQFLYKGILEVGAKIITNHQKKTIATKVIIKGNVEDPKTSLLSIIGYLLSHAFLHALLPQIDNSIEMQDVIWKNN